MSTMKSLQGFLEDDQGDLSMSKFLQLVDVLSDMIAITHELEEVEDLLNFMLEMDTNKNPMDPTKMKVCDRDIMTVAYHKVKAVRKALREEIEE